MTSFSNEEFLTVTEVAARLRLNDQTIRNWIDRGKLPAFRIGRRVRIARSDFDRFVDGGYTQPPHRLERCQQGAGVLGRLEESVGDIREP